jgi:hypothetical protein
MLRPWSLACCSRIQYCTVQCGNRNCNRLVAAPVVIVQRCCRCRSDRASHRGSLNAVTTGSIVLVQRSATAPPRGTTRAGSGVLRQPARCHQPRAWTARVAHVPYWHDVCCGGAVHGQHLPRQQESYGPHGTDSCGAGPYGPHGTDSCGAAANISPRQQESYGMMWGWPGCGISGPRGWRGDPRFPHLVKQFLEMWQGGGGDGFGTALIDRRGTTKQWSARECVHPWRRRFCSTSAAGCAARSRQWLQGLVQRRGCGKATLPFLLSRSLDHKQTHNNSNNICLHTRSAVASSAHQLRRFRGCNGNQQRQ